MKKFLCLLLALFQILLAGCQEENGVYFEEVGAESVGEKYSGGLAGYATLCYEGKIYTAANTITYEDVSTCPVDTELLKLHGAVYCNNRILWSDEQDDLFEVTGMGTVYTMEGYDSDFLLCVDHVYESASGKTIRCWYAFVCLNDIRMEKGSELFVERYHLSEMPLTGVWNRKTQKECDPMSADLDPFITALNDGVFLDPTSEDYPTLDQNEGYDLTFLDPRGFHVYLVVCDDGRVFVKNSGQNTMVLSVDPAACEQLTASIK